MGSSSEANASVLSKGQPPIFLASFLVRLEVPSGSNSYAERSFARIEILISINRKNLPEINMSNGEVPDIDQWANKVGEESCNFWRDNFGDWEHGIKNWYTPLRVDPEIMIVTLNPGRSRQNYEQEDAKRHSHGDFSPPPQSEYTSPATSQWPISKALQRFFGDKHRGLLERSPGIPVIFFRSPHSDFINHLPRERRTLMISHCLATSREIILRLRPRKKILVVGISSYKYLESALGGFTDQQDVPPPGRRRIGTAYLLGIFSGAICGYILFENLFPKFLNWIVETQSILTIVLVTFLVSIISSAFIVSTFTHLYSE